MGRRSKKAKNASMKAKNASNSRKRHCGPRVYITPEEDKSAYEKHFSNPDNALQPKETKRRKTVPEIREEYEEKLVDITDERDDLPINHPRNFSINVIRRTPSIPFIIFRECFRRHPRRMRIG